MLQPHELIDAAVTVRDELDALVGDDADKLRSALEDLLGSPLEDEELAEAIRQLLSKHQGTREWLDAREGPEIASSLDDAPWPTVLPDIAASLEDSDGDNELLGPDTAERDDGGAAARTAYTRIDAPGEVAVGIEFEVVVGLRAEADPGVFGPAIDLPAGPTTVGVHVTADGIDAVPGSSWRHELVVEPSRELPHVTLGLIARPQDEPVREARIQVLFTVAGQAMGFGSRAITVVTDPSLMTGRPPDQPEPGTAAALPVQDAPPDLTIWLRKGTADGDLLWTFTTSTGVAVPAAPLERSIGTDTQTFAKSLILKVNGLEGKASLYLYLRGVGKAIADKMPLELFDLLGAVAKRVGRRPLVQLLTEEPYVPWELAWLDAPLDDALPPYLGAQALVGRWLTGTRRPQSPPPAVATGTAIAVIWGVYDQVPGWRRLVAAEEEAAALTADYGARSVDAALVPVLAVLGGDPRADVLHFAVHGNYDQTGGMDGLVLVDRELVDPYIVEGMTLAGAPFVFLNACQVGTGQEVLGDYAGLAAAFLKAGACAVVAPLWSVKDTIAKELALSFYERVLDGEAPAEVLRSERASAEASRTPPSATAFAYQFFGHPAMTLHENDEEDE